MARLSREQWSADYRRRIERGEARGMSRQEARGHREKVRGLPAEHKRREQTQRARGELTESDKRFARKQALRGDVEEEDARNALRAMPPDIRALLKAEVRAQEKKRPRNRDWPRLQEMFREWIGEDLRYLEYFGGT